MFEVAKQTHSALSFINSVTFPIHVDIVVKKRFPHPSNCYPVSYASVIYQSRGNSRFSPVALDRKLLRGFRVRVF